MQTVAADTEISARGACQNPAEVARAGPDGTPSAGQTHPTHGCEGRAWSAFWVGLLVLFAFAAVIAIISLMARGVRSLRLRRAA